MKNYLCLLFIVSLFNSCAVMSNKNFSDRQFKIMLVKNVWIDAGQGFGYFYNYEKFKQQGGYRGYQYSLITFKKNKSFDYNRVFGGKEGTLDSLYIIKYENTYWNVKKKQLYTKARVTYRDFNLKDSTISEAILDEEKVYDIDIRKSESIKDLEIQFTEIKELEKWNRLQDYKVIKSLKIQNSL